MNFRSLVWVLTLAVLLMGDPVWALKSSGSEARQLYGQARKAYHSLKHSDPGNISRAAWQGVIEKFKKVAVRYPGSHEAYKAVFTLGRLNHDLARRFGKADDYDAAMTYYQKLVMGFPPGRLSDDALFHLGEIQAQRKNYAAARATFRKVLARFPKGDQVSSARQQLKAVELLEQKPADTRSTAVENLASLYQLSHARGPSGVTRVTLRTNGKVKFTQKRLHHPDRIYLDFENARWDGSIPESTPVHDGILKQIRLSRFDDDTSRLVLDLERSARVEVLARADKQILEIRLSTQEAARAAVVKNPGSGKLRARKASLKSAEKPGHSTKPVVKSKAVPLVVLDAGHGGKDNGAKGPGGLMEKHVNLSIAKRVKRILEKRYKYHVLMTRDNDTFLELKERGDIANRHDADLFVSIHANAAERRSAKGIETYYLGSGASQQALETAARENGDLVGSALNDEVQEILASLITTTKINDSSRLATKVQNKMVKTMKKKYRGVNDLGVKEGPFFVLHSTNMASILVEVGFVTNYEEEKKLKQKKYRNLLAESIAAAIHEYLKQKAPSI